MTLTRRQRAHSYDREHNPQSNRCSLRCHNFFILVSTRLDFEIVCSVGLTGGYSKISSLGRQTRMDLRISVRCHVEMSEITSSHRTLTQEHEPCRTKQETCSWSHLAEESNFYTAGGNETPNKDSQMRGARGKNCRIPAVAAEAARPGHGSKRTRCNPVHGGATVVFLCDCSSVKALIAAPQGCCGRCR